METPIGVRTSKQYMLSQISHEQSFPGISLRASPEAETIMLGLPVAPRTSTQTDYQNQISMGLSLSRGTYEIHHHVRGREVSHLSSCYIAAWKSISCLLTAMEQTTLAALYIVGLPCCVTTESQLRIREKWITVSGL